MTVSGRALAGALVILLALALAGCAEKPPKATTTSDDPAGKTQCLANQETMENQIHQALLDNPDIRLPMQFAQLKKAGLVTELLWCPAGGDMVFVPNEGGFVECSIHGRWSF